ncbi:CHY zinc finger protein [Halovenus salina]|uniref:CHY zinc finger protein n=1 Tax=Halovenus salina TaxID=1510225 RepID=A0ABD5W9I7_9EURY|nr:CHY zinc finger protein [Halovenus salina]
MTQTTTAPETDDRFGVPVRGIAVDDETRCRHWDDVVDVVALRFACCGTYYPCYECHAAATDHEPERWPRDRFDESAVLCGLCREELTVDAYLDCGDSCPACGASFNPGCREHHHLYFET